MQTLSTTRTAALLAIVMVTAGCGARATGSVGSPSDQGPATDARTSTSTTSTTVADVLRSGEQVESTSPEVTPQISSSTTAPDVAAAPQLAVEDVDSMIDGVDETLAELDQLLNNLAAVLAAEEGEIIP